ncbi:hypothetical protein SDC9_105020 [bioreactor metagenome]|uniref:Uncharacterized protein n=1 Tax=bioreactor metagenome TaxID=1076179 RepID=A0A645AYE7_9ZZZZ
MYITHGLLKVSIHGIAVECGILDDPCLYILESLPEFSGRFPILCSLQGVLEPEVLPVCSGQFVPECTHPFTTVLQICNETTDFLFLLIYTFSPEFCKIFEKSSPFSLGYQVPLGLPQFLVQGDIGLL